MADYYDEKKNFLFVKKGKEDQLQDYIFIHLDKVENLSFLAHYETFMDDVPFELYKLEKILSMKDDLFSSIEHLDAKEEQTWKRVRVCGILPSKWRIFFEQIEGKLKL